MPPVLSVGDRYEMHSSLLPELNYRATCAESGQQFKKNRSSACSTYIRHMTSVTVWSRRKTRDILGKWDKLAGFDFKGRQQSSFPNLSFYSVLVSLCIYLCYIFVFQQEQMDIILMLTDLCGIPRNCLLNKINKCSKKKKKACVKCFISKSSYWWNLKIRQSHLDTVIFYSKVLV